MENITIDPARQSERTEQLLDVAGPGAEAPQPVPFVAPDMLRESENKFRCMLDAGYPGILPLMRADGILAPGADIVPGKSPARMIGVNIWGGLGGWPDLIATLELADKWHGWQANVGLRPGPDVVVFDIDEFDQAIGDSIEQVITEVVGVPLPCRYGNKHKRALVAGLTSPLEKTKTEIKYDTGQVEIRSGNHQVVVYGTHPITTEPYRWTRPLVPRDQLPNITPEQVAEIEARLEAMLPDATTTSSSGGSRRDPESLKLHPAGLSVVIKAVDSLTNDEDTTRDEWSSTGHAIRAAFVDYPGTGLECWERYSEKYPDPDPDETQRFWDTLRPENGFEVGAQDLLRWADGGHFGALSIEYWFEAVPAASDDNGGKAQAGSLITPTAYRYRAAPSIPPRQWLHAGHYIKKFVSVSVAPGGTGKSSHALVDAIAMATGKKLLHDRPHRRCRVWMFNSEDPLEETERRVAAVLLAYGIAPAELEGWLFLDSGRTQRLTLASETREGFVLHVPVYEAILAGVEENGIDVLMLDPFISAHRVKESDNDAIDAVVKELARLAEKANISVELIHHVRKLGGAEVTVEDARGASALVDAARSARTLTKMTAEEGRRFQVDNHRRYIRLGGDPKANMTAPPATQDTKWMELRSVSLDNGTPEYPQGDSVGVVMPFTPEHIDEQITNAALMEERQVIAGAVLDALAGEPEAQLSQLAAAVTPALNEHQITKSKDRLVTRDIITAALAGKSGVTVERDGHLVRVRAEKRGIGPKAPWVVVATAAELPVDESDAKKSVFS